LFDSYLSHRKQQVKLFKEGKPYTSIIKENQNGIAQGSILGATTLCNLHE